MNSKISTITLPIKIIFKTDKFKFAILSCISFLSAYCNYLILQSLAAVLNSNIGELFSDQNTLTTLMPVIAYLSISILQFISMPLIQKLEYKIGLYVNNEIIKKTFNFKGIGVFENPEYTEMSYNIAEAKSVMTSSVSSFFKFLSLTLNLIAYISFFAKAELIFLFAIIPAVIPLYFTEKFKAGIFMQKQFAMQQMRLRGYQYKFMALSPQHAQDNRIFSFIPLLKNQFDNLNNNILKTWNSFNNKKLLIDFTSFLTKIAVTSFVVFVSFFRFSNNKISFGESLVLIFAVYRIFKTASIISEQIGVNKQTFMFYEYLNNFLSLSDNIDLSKSNKILNEPISSIEFQNINFAYPKNPNLVLNNLSFKIKTGESIALVGKNGAGKTTIVKLLLRFYDPLSGKILINGTDIKELEIDSYRKAVSGVFQDFSKFALTVNENIYGDGTFYNSTESYSQKDTDNLLLKIIETMPNKYEELVGKDLGGRELSGGEWQKLAIARSLKKSGTSLFLGDEPVSAIDPIEEANIYKFLLPAKEDKMIRIITTHRLACTKDVSKILLLEKGTAASFDSHEKLLQASEIYRQMYNTQAGMYV